MLRSFQFGAKKMTARSLPAMQFSDAWKKKEVADEQVYFNKQEAKLMKDLLEKMTIQSEVQEPTKEKTKEFCDELRKVLSKHDIQENFDLISDLLEWKKDL